MFILAAPSCSQRGEYEGARLLDIAPTLLDLAGYEIPASMQGQSLLTETQDRGVRTVRANKVSESRWQN
jgi:arylsulfatase A-like enzyme